jgi:hypothetical protein
MHMLQTLRQGAVWLGGILLGVLLIAAPARAGFGITPAQIVNERLPKGGSINLEVYLVREDASAAWNIIVNNDLKKMKNWVDIAEGNESFVMPTGTNRLPLHIKLAVPQDAPYDYYEGVLSFETKTPGMTAGKGNSVQLAVGVGTKFKITVTDKEYYDFKFNLLTLPQIETGWPVKTVVSIDNTGNVPSHPSKVHLDFYDYYDKKIVVQSGDSSDFSFVEPFTKGDSVGYIKANLPVGKYYVHYLVYKADGVVADDYTLLDVLPRWSLSEKPWLVKVFEYLTATPLRVAISSVVGTLLILIIISLILKVMRRKEERE